MARDQIQEVKEKTDIVALISSYLALTKAGRHYKGLCPFHNERTPSFIVSPELQIFKCFGCSESGDVFSFLEKYEGMEFYEALRFLAEKAGVKLQSVDFSSTSEKERLFKINELASKFYQYLLLNHPVGKKALKYLTESRGLDLITIRTFGLGFAPQKSILLQFLSKKKFDLSEIEKAGLIIKGRGDYFDRFSGRVIFPITDTRGNVIGLSGRVLPEYDNGRMGKYINSPETLVYHKSSSLYGINVTKNEIRKSKWAIIVEGELDLISLWKSGFKNAVAIKGSAVTHEQAKILSRICSEVILALDSDWAGVEAMIRGVKIIDETGLSMRICRFLKYKDPDEAVRNDPKYFSKSLEDSIGVWDFVINSIFESVKLKSANSRIILSRKLVPVLSQIGDSIVQAHYVKMVSKKLGVSEEAVFEQIENVEKNKKIETSYVPKKEERSIRDGLESRLLRIYVNNDPRALLESETKELFKEPLLIRIIEEVAKYLKKHKKFEVSDFSKEIPTELFEGFSNLIMKEDSENLSDAREISLEIIKLELEDLEKVISRFESGRDKKKLSEALKKHSLLTKRRSVLDLG